VLCQPASAAIACRAAADRMSGALTTTSAGVHMRATQ